MNYEGFILGCITVILILLIVCAFIYPNTIYDSSIILLTAISSIAWIIVYMSTRTLRCIQNDNPKELICKIGGNGRKYKIKGGITGEISNKERINIKTFLSIMFKNNNNYNSDELKNMYDDIMNRLNITLDCNRQQDSAEFVQAIIDKVFDNGNIIENAYYFSDLSTKLSPITINTDYTWDDKCKLNETKIIEKELVDQIFFALCDSIRSKMITQSDIYVQNIQNIEKISKIIIKYKDIKEKANISLNKIKKEQKLRCDNITDIFITVIIRRIIDDYGFFSPLFNESFYIMNVQSTIYMNTQPDNNYEKLLEEIVLRKKYITEFDEYQLVAFNELQGISTQGEFINSNRMVNTGHYVSYVLRNINGKYTVYECNDSNIDELANYSSLEELMKSKINIKHIRITMLLFAKKNNIKTDIPTGLQNFSGVACFVNSGMQLLLSTDLFDNKIKNTIDSNSQNVQDTIEFDTKDENTERAKTSIPTPASTPEKTPVQQNKQALTVPASPSKTKSLIGIIYTPDGKFTNINEQNYADYGKINNSVIYNTITKPTLVIYNENFTQYANKDINPGGGNGIIRPLRYDVTNRKNNNNLYVLGIPTSDINQTKQIDAKKLGYEEPIDNIIGLINDKKIEVVIFGTSSKEYTLGIEIFNNDKGEHPYAESNRKYYFDMLINGLGNDFQKYYFANNINSYSLTYNGKDVKRLPSLQKLLTTSETSAKTPAPTPTPVQQNKPQTAAQKEAQQKIQEEAQKNLEESKKNETKMKEVELTQPDLDKINKWTKIIRNNTVITDDNLKKDLIKYLNDNIFKKDVLKNIIDKLYNEYTIQNNDNYDKTRKYYEDTKLNLDLYKYYYDICKQYETFINNIQKINLYEYKRLNDVYTNKITEDNNDNIIEDDNIKTSYKKMLDTPIFTLINDYTTYMERPFYNRMIENSNLDIKDRYDIQNLLPPDSRILIYAFKKHKIAEKLNNFKLVYKLIEWRSILDRTTLDSLNNNDESDELAEEENNDNLDKYADGIVTDDNTSNQSIYYIQRTPIRNLIEKKFITDINDKNKKLQNIIRRKAMRLFITFKKKIETDDQSINNVDNQIQNFINFVNNPFIYDNIDDFEISEPYISYGSSYSPDNIKKISKRYGTDTTSFDKFYKELLNSEIL